MEAEVLVAPPPQLTVQRHPQVLNSISMHMYGLKVNL